jgi:peptide/nickel transport system substrate-binding protein
LIRGIVVGTSSEQQKTEIVAPARASSRPKGTMVWVAVIVVVLIVAGIAGAWAAGLIGGTSDEKVLVIAMSSNVETMDPAKTSAMYGPPGMIYETLITRDLTGAFRPGLAEWWNLNTTDPDHPTFEIRLQQGVTFHDGLPFDTDAVKRIINYYSNEDSWVQYEFWAVYGCENKTGWPDAGIWCKDAYNMVLNLTWADVALQFNLSHLYGSMMGPDALESDGLENYGTVDHKVVGTGPFMLDEWVANDHVTLVKNPEPLRSTRSSTGSSRTRRPGSQGSRAVRSMCSSRCLRTRSRPT